MDNLFQLGVNLSKGLRDEDEDISRVLAHTDDPQTSKDAAEKMVKSGALNRQEQWVYNLIVRYVNSHPLDCDKNFTTKDIAHWTYAVAYDKAYDICRKRFSGLRDKGKIEPIPKTVMLFGKPHKVKSTKTNKLVYRRRDGCRVWKLL